MANICDSRVTITGPSEERARLLDEVSGHDEIGDWIPIDFDRVVPEPDLPIDELLVWRRRHWGVDRKPGASFSALIETDDPSETVVMLATPTRHPSR